MSLSPQRWNIAWRVRLGLLVVPCVLALLAWYQFRVTADTVNQYRDIVADTDSLLVNSTKMMQNAEAMDNHMRRLHLWLQGSASGAPSTSADEAEKAFAVPYREAQSAFEKAYQDAARQVPPDSTLEKRLTDFYDAGLAWQRDVADPLIGALRDPKTLGAQISWRPFDDAGTAFAATRDELMLFRQGALAGADHFRSLSTLSVLAMEAAALIMAIWIGVGLSRAVTSPLATMVARSRRIEAGDYASAPVTSNDEFGEVTGAMNAMTTSIAARLERERLSGRITAAVTRSLDTATVLQTTARELGEAMHASRCVLCLPREASDGGPLFFQWTAPGIASHETSLCTPQALPQAWRLVLQNKEVLRVPDSEEWADIARESLENHGTLAMLAAPLLLRDQTAGLIALECTTPRDWQPSESELLQHVAAQVAVALDNARLLRESEQRAEQLRAAHDALKASGAQLRAQNSELEEFVYTVSHDLKSPLISIQGYLDALRQDFGDELPPDSQHYLERVNANAKRLEGLIGDLIELSRIGRVHEQWEMTDTRQLAREAAAELALQAQSRAVQVEIAHDLPTVICEKKRVRQMFTNLLDNAIKYSDPAKPSRTVKVACEETPTHWQFAVSDNGVGLEADGLEKAFGIFQRVGNSTVPGSGIGLSIVQRAAQAHDGRSWAVSDGAGQGTTFYFTLTKKPDVPESETL